MKKVFRLWKYVDDMLGVDVSSIEVLIWSLRLGWPQKCDGLTLDEMLAQGYGCNDDWCVLEE